MKTKLFTHEINLSALSRRLLGINSSVFTFFRIEFNLIIFCAMLFLSVDVHAQDHRKVRTANESDVQGAMELNRKTKSLEKPNSINVQHDHLEEVKDTLELNKAYFKNSLKRSFNLINSKKSNSENWIQLEALFLERFKTEVPSYNFEELKLSFDDDEFLYWFENTSTLNEVRLYNHHLEILNKSL
jgi:hypothetical protein